MTKRRPGNPLLAIAYIRVSTDDQRRGPEAQHANIEHYARQNGIQILGVFLDERVSGADALCDRPELKLVK